jgi:hypothetical protein
MSVQKIGLIVGREWSFPPAFIEEVNRRDEGVVAEYVKLGTPGMTDAVGYAVIIDRLSHEVPFYRTYLKHAALSGTVVINNPFLAAADDRFFGASLVHRLGIATPKTVLLPHREYAPGIVHEESLRNLDYPLDWQAVVDHVGLPCMLKEASVGEPQHVSVCHSVEELLHRYNESGRLLMMVQELVEWEHFVRCLVVGRDLVLPMKYDPRERRHHLEHEHLSPELGQRIVDDSLKLVRALGHDMGSLQWAVREDVPYAIELLDPAPDMDIYSLTPHYFGWAVEKMADMAIRLAKTPPPRGAELRRVAFPVGAPPHPAVATERTGRLAPRDGDLAGDLPTLARDLPRPDL